MKVIHEITAKLAMFNGTVTLHNTKTNRHVYVELKTEKWTTKQGDKTTTTKRRVAKWYEPGNAWAAKSFAFVSEDGTLQLWRKFDDKSTEGKLAKLLNLPFQATEAGVSFGFETRCRICDRALVHPESLRTGIGPVCLDNLGAKDTWRRLDAMSDRELMGELRGERAKPKTPWLKMWLIYGAFKNEDLREAAFWGEANAYKRAL